ncbi:Nicastrin [Paramuricea clavata]|uniref:Nicastrin n=1 Tax=Paramuricea clavata TaxID=317549 RepID=A0A6S7GTY9_PARCT|nr:Nicastrin [Paramuricea clavata]
MAYFQIFLRVNIIFILLFSVLKIKVYGDKIEQSIYSQISGYSSCVTLLNATHQIGCTSKRKGNVGVVHYIDSDENFKWLLNKGKYSPYVSLFTAEYFTDDRLKQLINADKLSGALVLYARNFTINGTNPPNSGFSPEYPCPNEKFGLYGSNGVYSCSGNGSNSVTWNDNGSEMSYRDYGIPVFALYKENEINNLIKCYKDHNKPVNGENPDYPLCGVEMMSFMHAAKDTPTCMRKSSAPKYTQNGFCDPLGDKNVWGTLFSFADDSFTHNDVILATAKLDSTAFFHDLAPGADNDATGVTVLLAAAEVLGNLTRNDSIKAPDLKKNQKHIMFSFFHGEVWDYIGSSRMVYDMMNGDFPDKGLKLPRLDLSNIAYYLELNQVGLLDENSLWAHRDPESEEHVRSKTKTMFNTLSKFGASVNLAIKDPSQSKVQPLPPASFQRFLKGNRSIPGLVIADHKAAYTNKFYNSRFDDVQRLDVKHLTKLATTVAKTLYELAYNETNDDMAANEERVTELLGCLIVNQNCSLFKQVVTKDKAYRLASQNGPLPRYVGTDNKLNGPSGITVMTQYLLAYFTGINLNVTGCPAGSGNVISYITMLMAHASGQVYILHQQNLQHSYLKTMVQLNTPLGQKAGGGMTIVYGCS